MIANNASFGMVTITNNHKNCRASSFMRSSKGLQSGLKRSQKELKKEKQKCLLIEAAPLELGIEKAYFSADILLTICAQADDEIKDQLRSTCRFMAKKISIQRPCVGALVANPLFHTSSNNIVFIALNAAWDGDNNTLEALLEKVEKGLEIYYRYPVNDDQTGHFHISDIIAAKKIMHSAGSVSVWDTMDAALKKHNMELSPYSHRCNELMMACYNGDTNRINKYFLDPKDADSEKFYVDVKKSLWIAINRNKPECIALLAPHIQKFDQAVDDLGAFWEVLVVAIKHNKMKSFEALVAHDIYGSLNYTHDNESILDWINYWVDDGAFDVSCAETYKRLGGKTYAELSSAQK